MPIIEIKKLTKKFGDNVAVNGIDLNVEEGEVFGFLGPNGAGKTTTISMLATVLHPTSGEAFLNGFSIKKQQDDVRKSIGIVFQDPSLDTELTGKENLDFHGRLYGMDREHREKRVKEVLELVELSQEADKIVKKYSGGMKRRLEIARGLMHQPKVLFLDEPSLGLDPQARRKLWEYVKNLNDKAGVTILLTTHYMDEADYLCDRVAIIDLGKIVASDDTENLKAVLGGDVITLGTNKPTELKSLLLQDKHIAQVKIYDHQMNVVSKDGDKEIPRIIKCAEKAGIDIKSVMLKRPSLEDVFIHYTGKQLRREEADAKDLLRDRFRRRHG
jgi:ABC-2 type transport system ATP-binding protein